MLDDMDQMATTMEAELKTTSEYKHYLSKQRSIRIRLNNARSRLASLPRDLVEGHIAKEKYLQAKDEQAEKARLLELEEQEVKNLYNECFSPVGHGPYTSIPREEWEIIENALPPIITKETYDLAWSSIKHSNRRTGRKEKSPPKHSVLSKKLYCGCCGMQMRLKKRKGLIYICPSAEFKPEGNQCELVQCSAAALEAVVLDTVNQLARLSAKQVNLAVQKQKSAEQKIASVERSIAKVRRKLSTIGQKRQELFEQMVSGAITPETFLQHKGSLRQQEQEQQAIVQALGEELVRMKLDLVESKEHSTETPVYEALETLTLDVVNRLIKKIVIYDNRSPEIIFNFKDCIRQ